MSQEDGTNIPERKVSLILIYFKSGFFINDYQSIRKPLHLHLKTVSLSHKHIET